jgi:tetratricopeptide (TPR) repeat protein
MLRHALALTLVLAVGATARAQDWKGMGRLEGKVTNEKDGKPIANATVKLDLPERGGGTTVTTNKKGRWAVLSVAAGKWNIDVSADGYVTKRITVVLPAELVRIPPIEVGLVKAGPPPELLDAAKKADEAYKAGHYAEARVEYEKLLAARPDLANTIHQQMGFSWIQEKQYEKGLEELKKVMEADPTNMQIRAIAAQAALEGGLFDEAKTLLAGLDESTITSPDVFFNMGVNFLNAGKTDDAISYFTKAIERDPKYVDGYYRRALGYLQLGKQAECKADMQKVVELAPDTPEGANAKKVLEQLK